MLNVREILLAAKATSFITAPDGSVSYMGRNRVQRAILRVYDDGRRRPFGNGRERGGRAHPNLSPGDGLYRDFRRAVSRAPIGLSPGLGLGL